MAYIPLQLIVPQFMDENGDPMSGGTLYFYKAGTSTATSLYSDNTGTSLGTSVTINSRGYPESGGNVVNLFRDAGIAIKLVLKDSDGATVWTADNLPTSANFDSTSSAKLSGIEAGADVTDATNVGAVVLGSQDVFIRAQDMFLPVDSPAGAAAAVADGSGLGNYYGFPFDGSTQEYVHFDWVPPTRYNGGTVGVRFLWTTEATDTDSAVWAIAAVGIQDGTAIKGQKFGTQVTIDDAAQGAAGRLYQTGELTLTISNAAADRPTQFQVARKPGDASDTMTEDAILLGVVITYQSDALNDD